MNMHSMKALLKIILRIAVSLLGCIVVFNAFYLTRHFNAAHHAALKATDVLLAPLALLWKYPSTAVWPFHGYTTLLGKDILLLAVLAAAIYLFERKKTGSLAELILFYAIVPPLIWFAWFYFIVIVV